MEMVRGGYVLQFEGSIKNKNGKALGILLKKNALSKYPTKNPATKVEAAIEKVKFSTR
jgi:hypothetical protein